MKQIIKTIPTDRIKDPERPLRANLTPESVDDLVFSIREVGIIQPLIVCESGDGFELIAGHRRLLAAEVLQLNEVPCLVVETNNQDKEVLKLHENIGRQDISPIDWANHLDYLKQQYKLSNAKLAEMIGFSEGWVSEHLEVLNYPEEVLVAIKEGTLAFSAARELAKIKDTNKRRVYVKAAVRGGVTPSMAARWKMEANREEIRQEETTATPPSQNPEGPVEPVLPACPVCGLPIPFNEIITLQVHDACQPTAPSDEVPPITP